MVAIRLLCKNVMFAFSFTLDSCQWTEEKAPVLPGSISCHFDGRRYGSPETLIWFPVLHGVSSNSLVAEQQNVIESLWRDADRYFDWWKVRWLCRDEPNLALHVLLLAGSTAHNIGCFLLWSTLYCFYAGRRTICSTLHVLVISRISAVADSFGMSFLQMEHQSFFQNRVTSTELYITYVMHMTSLCTVMVYVQRLPSIRLMKEDYAVSLRRLKEKSPHPSVSQKWKTYFRIIDKRCLLRAAAGFSSLPAGFWGYVFCSDWLSVDGTRRYSYDDLPPLLIWLPLTSVFITVATFICVHMYMNLADEIKKMDQLKYELKGA